MGRRAKRRVRSEKKKKTHAHTHPHPACRTTHVDAHAFRGWYC